MRYLLATILVATVALAGITGAAFAGRGDGSDAPAAEPKISASIGGVALFGAAEPGRAALSPASTDAENKRSLAR